MPDNTNVADATASEIGSEGETSTSADFRTRLTAIDAASPTARPIASGSIPCLSTSSRISRAVAPTAMRIPISCVRRLTECAISAYRPTEASSKAIAASIRNKTP